MKKQDPNCRCALPGKGANVSKIVTTSSQLQVYHNVDREQRTTFPERGSQKHTYPPVFAERQGYCWHTARKMPQRKHGPREAETPAHQRPESQNRERALGPPAETKGQDPECLEGPQGVNMLGFARCCVSIFPG